ncbi:MAG: carbohydrate binding domain-containing protein [Opitutaceae bacterium]|nr:carbohydrate binding domain-containing protein [Cytophagales bacterium]
MKTQIACSLLLLFSFFSVHAQENQLKNPGFELDGDGWNYFGGLRIEDTHSGKFCLKVTQEKPSWAGAEQILRLPKKVSSVEVKGWMKYENVVQGTENYEVVRIAVEFLDEAGNVTGGYPPVVGNGVGTADWKKFENTYDVPETAVKVKLQISLANCAGTAFYDDLELYMKGEGGENLKALKSTGPIDWGSWYTIPVDAAKTGSHYVDWSSLLDAPAGKHGFAIVKEGRIYFNDGTPIRFWGTNLVAGKCFPEKKQADSLALRLSKMGCNLLRLHHMDAPWATPNIFGNKETTRFLSNQSLDKLDYLISALKKKGIYVFLDLLVHRDFLESDGVANKPPDLGGKQVGYFDEKLIQLQKEYIKQLLTHKNSYTGLAYKDEPAIVASEFINESSAFLHFQGDIVTPTYRESLEEKFIADPQNSGKILARFELDYSSKLSPVLKQRTGDKGDVKESMKFLSGIEQKYYSTMSAHMRSLGVKYLLSGSNFPNPVLVYQYDNTKMDLLTTNDYWDHPQVWKLNNEWEKIEIAPINNTSILKNHKIGPINNIAKYRWKDKPLIVTEYNMCFPNEYRLEGVPYLAAYSRLQGFDGMLQFHFDPEVAGQEGKYSFAINNMPDHLAQWVAAAPMFLGDYIKEAPSFVVDKVTENQIFSLPSYSDFIDILDYLPLVTRVGKQSGEQAGTPTESFKKYFDEASQTITSETKELSLNRKAGIIKINTAKVQGVIGALKDSVFSFPAITISLKNPWASVIAVSKDKRPLNESKHYYLVVTTPVRTKGMKYSDSRNSVSEIGDRILQAQFAMGTIKFNGKDQVKIRPVNMSGSKEAEIRPVGNLLNISSSRSFVFEVVVE